MRDLSAFFVGANAGRSMGATVLAILPVGMAAYRGDRFSRDPHMR